jgi:hypothetical protein
MARAKIQAKQIIHAPVDVDGVAYARIAIAPQLKMFACAPLRATLSQTGCAARWRAAQIATGYEADRLMVCRSCPVGAAHAGEEAIKYSPLYGSHICPRCRKGAFRMINNRRCISCFNRERELRDGKNARGNKPKGLLLKPLHGVEIKVAVNDNVQRLRVTMVIDTLEPMLQMLRTTPGELAFAFAGPLDGLRQGRLF